MVNEDIELVNCSCCGGQAYEDFCDNFDLHVTAVAVIKCYGCENESETFSLPDDKSLGNPAMGQCIERLAKLHWNMINNR